MYKVYKPTPKHLGILIVRMNSDNKKQNKNTSSEKKTCSGNEIKKRVTKDNN